MTSRGALLPSAAHVLALLALAASVGVSRAASCSSPKAAAGAGGSGAPSPSGLPDPSGGVGVSVVSYGAACDGATDDSAPLQKGIDAATAQGFALLIPVGQCNFSQTLTVNRGPTGVAIKGERGQGAQSSVLHYTGTGTALLAKNPTGNSFIYNLIFKDFALTAGVTAQVGFDATLLSEAQLKNFSVVSSDGKFSQAWRCRGCNILYIDGLILSGQDAGVDFIDASAIFLSHGDFFAQASYVFKFEGSVSHIVIRDSWFEQQDYALLFDTGDIAFVEVTGNRFLFNGGAALTHQRLAEFDDSAGGPVTVLGFHFSGNSGYCAPGLCNAPYFILANLPASATGSSVTLWIEHNVLQGNGTGAVDALGPEGAVHGSLVDNEVVDARSGASVKSQAGPLTRFTVR